MDNYYRRIPTGTFTSPPHDPEREPLFLAGHLANYEELTRFLCGPHCSINHIVDHAYKAELLGARVIPLKNDDDDVHLGMLMIGQAVSPKDLCEGIVLMAEGYDKHGHPEDDKPLQHDWANLDALFGPKFARKHSLLALVYDERLFDPYPRTRPMHVTTYTYVGDMEHLEMDEVWDRERFELLRTMHIPQASAVIIECETESNENVCTELETVGERRMEVVKAENDGFDSSSR